MSNAVDPRPIPHNEPRRWKRSQIVIHRELPRLFKIPLSEVWNGYYKDHFVDPVGVHFIADFPVPTDLGDPDKFDWDVLYEKLDEIDGVLVP